VFPRSVEDLFLWDQAFYTNALGKDVMDMIQTPGTLDNGTKIEYAWGLRVFASRGLKAVEHGGAWAGFRAEILRFPDQRFSVIANGKLTIRTRSIFDLPLAPTGTDRFLLSGPGWNGIFLEFVRGAGKTITGFTVNAGRMRGVAFVKTK
jgi:hypothetical protein